MQSAIGDKLAKALLSGEITDGDEVVVDLDSTSDGLTVKQRGAGLADPPGLN